jgi:hypothetical protein
MAAGEDIAQSTSVGGMAANLGSNRMNAIIKLDLSYPNHLFNTKEEWDSYRLSFEKYHQQVWDNPDKFPCIAIATHYEHNDNGRDYQHHYFFYDFTLETET